MLGLIAFLFFFILEAANSSDDIVFLQDYLQFQFLKWIDCETNEQIPLVNVDGKQQLRLQKAQRICLNLNNHLSLDDDQSYDYTFIFNRSLNLDELYIFIDYKMYNLSNIINNEPFVQIQHYHFLTCSNQIELLLNSSASIDLVFIYLAKIRTNTKDLVRLVGQIPYEDNENIFYYDFRQSLELEIKNNTLYYKAILPKIYEQNFQLYWFKLYLNNSLLPLSISQLDDSNISFINGSKHLVVDNIHKLHNLDFMIKNQFQIKQMFLFKENDQSLNFEAITQIDSSSSSLAKEDILFKKSFTPFDQVQMQVEVQQIVNNNSILITILPKYYYKSIQNIEIINAKINIKNETQETVLDCFFIEGDQNQSCLYYNSTSFQFKVNWIFESNTQYSFELSGTLKKNIEADPFIFFQTGLVYFQIADIEAQNKKGIWIGYLLLLYLILPGFIYLICVLCILSLKAYHPYIKYIIEQDEINFQSGRRDSSARYQIPYQQQQSEEARQ